MDAVLGLSVTPSAVGLVLVEGQLADGATVDREAFEIRPGRHATALQTSEQAAAAVLRTEAIAASRGHRLHSIGVTWSDDADTEASLLLRNLTDRGFDNVVPIRLPEATEALAWGVAEVIGHDVTAVCVVEPETVIALIVHARDGAVQTAVNHSIDTEQALIRWLSAVFTRADWRPEALVVVGSGGDLDALMPRLEDVLGVPVYAPAEAELALARGAALASTHNSEAIFDDHRATRVRHNDRRRPLAQTGPLAMLVAGAVTFVVSVSVAVSTEMAPQRDATPAEPTPAAKTSSDTAVAAADPLPADPAPQVAVPAPLAQTPLAPPPEAPLPVDTAPPPEALPAEPTPPEVLPVDGVPVAPVAPLPPGAPAIPPPGSPLAALPPESLAPGLVPAEPTPVPEQRPGILRRIKDRLSNIGNNDQTQAVQQAPAALPAPDATLPPPEALMAPPPEAAPAPEAPPAPPPPTDAPAPLPPPEAAPLPPPA